MSSNIKKIAIKLASDGPVKVLPTQRKVQILLGARFIVRTTSAVYLWEHPYYPQFYVPKRDLLAIKDIDSVELQEGEKIQNDSGRHIATQYTIKVPGKSCDEVVAFTDDLEGKAEPLRGLVKIDFGAMDQWFEEDTPIHVHPKDPFKRIDILPSTRDVKVIVDGQEVAHTTTSMHLYETGLPCRYYIPLTSIADLSILKPSSMRTQCPYKGEAEYWNVEINGNLHENLFWYYTRPTLESNKIEGLICPYNEKVDIELDGVRLERPDTHFGRSKVGQKPSIA